MNIFKREFHLGGVKLPRNYPPSCPASENAQQLRELTLQAWQPELHPWNPCEGGGGG